MEKGYCVYMHTFPNGKVYIGQTRQAPTERFRAGKGYKNKYVYEAIQEYGWENVKHEILAEGLNKEEADNLETALIAKHRSTEKEYGYNMTTGGSSGYEYTEEARKNISAALTGRTGRPLTDQQRQHLSEIMKARQAVSPMWEHLTPYKYKKGHPPSEKSMQILKEKLSKRVCQYDLNGDMIAEYPSIKDASEAMNMSQNAVGNAVRGYNKTAGGFVWKYAD